MRQLTQLKETERRNFSSRIAQFVLDGVNETYAKNKETVTIPLPKALNKEQRNWIKHEHSEALIGSILYQLMMDPVRATTLLASLNSNAFDIDEALYLQEETAASEASLGDYTQEAHAEDETNADSETEWKSIDDELDGLNLDSLQGEIHSQDEETTEDEDDDDLLGDFLSRMND